MDVRLSEAFMAAFEAVSTAIPPPSCEHVLHIFPSFGIGGVPLRMVRIINHLGKRFRHSVIALDNNFEAAAGVAGDIDVKLLSMQRPTPGALHPVAGGALALRPLWADLLPTYHWG